MNSPNKTLYQFLEEAALTSHIPEHTVKGMLSACRMILEETAANKSFDPGTMDEIDIDTAFKNFEKSPRPKKYTSGSLDTYKSKFKRAVSEYRELLNGTKTAIRTRSQTPTIERGTTLTHYDFPIRPNLIVRLSLPTDLSIQDAERLSAFIRSLAFTKE